MKLMNQREYYEIIREKYNFTQGKRNIFIIGTPSHGNLGDYAIWFATQKILKEYFKDADVVDVNIEDFPTDIDAIFHLIRQEDVIILQGGGNMGNYYMDDEVIRRYVIARFRNNRIIMFPQTVCFSKDASGDYELENSIAIYAQNKNLVLIARDEISYQFLKGNFKNPVYVLPDVVLTLNLLDKNVKRNGVLLCLRNDIEGVRSETEKDKIKELVSKRYDKVIVSDTVIEFDGNKREREGRLAEKWQEFQSAELVVTDRLHGMVFAAVTGTRCVVLPNFNTKIQAAYESIKYLTYIKFVNTMEQLEEACEELEECTQTEYDEKDIKDKYMKIMAQCMQQPLIQETGEKMASYMLELGSYWDKNYFETVYWHKKLKESYQRAQNNIEELRSIERELQSTEKKLRNKDKEWNEKYSILEEYHDELKRSYERSEHHVAELQKSENEWRGRYEGCQMELVDSRMQVVEWSKKYRELEQMYHDTMKECEDLRIQFESPRCMLRGLWNSIRKRVKHD